MAAGGIGSIAQCTTKIVLGVASPHMTIPTYMNEIYPSGSPHPNVLLQADPSSGYRRSISMDTITTRNLGLESQKQDRYVNPNLGVAVQREKSSQQGSLTLRQRWRNSLRRRRKKTAVRRCCSMEILNSGEQENPERPKSEYKIPKDRSPQVSPSATPPMKIRNGKVVLNKCQSCADPEEYELVEVGGGDVLQSRPSHGLLKRARSHPPGAHRSLEEVLELDTQARKPNKERLFNFMSAKVRRRVDDLYPLRHPKHRDALIALLREDHEANAKDENGDSALHAIVKHKRNKRLDLLLTLLTHSNANVNLPAAEGNTALHFAAMEGDESIVKLLIAFGAQVNALNQYSHTPLDVALLYNHEKVVAHLDQVGGKLGEMCITYLEIPRLMSFHDVQQMNKTDSGSGSDEPDAPAATVDENESYRRSRAVSVKLKDFEEGKTAYSLFEQLQQCINARLEVSGSFATSTDEAIALTFQQRELVKYKRTGKEQVRVRGGSRVLCLDGGGMKGLVEIEVLMHLERATGRKVTELFDWIVGTSAGAIIALGLVYAKKSLQELKQLHFKMKDQVFGSSGIGIGFNSQALERLLKEELGTEMIMTDIRFPRILVAAVNKKTTIPELHFFNNCFDNEFSRYPVWKVARYTSAGPLYFTEFENYVDGGVLANNPCEYGLTAIQNYYRQKRQKLDLALVVSVGSGVYPSEELGKIDAQEFLFFGKHWFNMKDSLKKRAKNLVTLLMTALLESEAIAENCRSRMLEQGVPFYRFSPQLPEVIPAGETNLESLVNMINTTQATILADREMKELVDLFHLVAEMTRKLKARRICDKKLAKMMSCT